MTYLLISLFISAMEAKKSVIDITMELLGPKEHGRICIGADGMYPVYRIAEVLLASKEKLCFVDERKLECEQVCLEQDVIMMAEAI